MASSSSLFFSWVRPIDSNTSAVSFSFDAAEYGEYELSFQHQDNQQALLRNQFSLEEHRERARLGGKLVETRPW